LFEPATQGRERPAYLFIDGSDLVNI